MFRPKRRKIQAGVPSASMADCAFLMLFFFLSTTKFDAKYGLGIVLPGPPTEDTERRRLEDDALTRILINREGQISVNNDLVTLTELEHRVRGLLIMNPEMIFMLRTDRQSKYTNMVDVLDRLRVAGATRINLSTN
jgi:biopolymer transport protein ExbD